ncbi:MAG: LysR family transcriptional regulator [Kiritimatiellae bacterium]|jgi:DNA-binding transcriptional LysR family regulator|nr:LysR family transcriptional regulator [Kiritimatiellia bacterium]
MTLQQLRYVDQVATVGSISEAARKLFVSQPTLTEAVRTLEEELRIAIFNRSAKGVTVTREGEEFLASARQILDDAGRIQEKYTGKAVRRPQFAVSCQHYAFAVEAFMEVVKACTAKSYDFTLRETVTSEIIDDVARNRSEIGILYLSRRNERALMKILKKEDLSFEELLTAKPHVFIGKNHPLAKKKSISPGELDDYPYLSYEQGVENALYFAEEVMPAIDRKKNIRVRDRATMTKLMLGLNGYTVSSGARSKMYANDIVAVPLKLDDFIRIGLVRRSGISLSTAGEIFVSNIRLKASVASNKH